MQTLGQILEGAVNEFGIGGYVLDMTYDDEQREITVTTPIYGSDGHPCLNEAGDDVARAIWTCPIESTRP